MKPTVYIVDDDPDINRAVTQLVKLIHLDVKAYTSADAFLAAFRRTAPGCLVLDVRMPGMSGLELQRELLRNGNELPTIIITGYGDIRMAVEAMKAGAVEFLEKPFRTQELCDSIQRAVRLDQQRWQRRKQRERADRRLGDLTSAERHVMEMVVLGKTNKDIAEELGLSVRAIEDRRARMMKKLGVKTRAELLELATVASA